MTKHKNTPLEAIKRKLAAHGFTDFVTAAHTHRQSLDPGSYEYALITYLIENGVGMGNAKNWKQINAFLKKKGHRITKNNFQTKLLQLSRRSLFYIGSCNAGYFLFREDSDIAATLLFYQNRIAKEQAHMDALSFLAENAQFPPSDPDGQTMRDDRAAA